MIGDLLGHRMVTTTARYSPRRKFASPTGRQDRAPSTCRRPRWTCSRLCRPSRQSVGRSRRKAGQAHDRHRHGLADHPRVGRTAPRAHPRHPSFLRLAGARTRRGFADHRPLARSPQSRDNRAVCASRARLNEEIRGAHRRQHRRRCPLGGSIRALPKSAEPEARSLQNCRPRSSAHPASGPTNGRLNTPSCGSATRARGDSSRSANRLIHSTHLSEFRCHRCSVQSGGKSERQISGSSSSGVKRFSAMRRINLFTARSRN